MGAACFTQMFWASQVRKIASSSVGVTNFKVTFGQSVSFDGTIFFASGGARFLPGKPVSAIISDRLSEPDIAPGVPNTEAIRLGLEFEGGKVKGFIFRADTLKITPQRAVLVEAYLRLQYSTLGHLSRIDFRREYTKGGISDAIDADPEEAIALAKSFGLQ